MKLWEGVYRSYDDIDVEYDHAVGDSPSWTARQMERTAHSPVLAKQNKLLNYYSRKFIGPKIVDFGGSIGHAYLGLENKEVFYNVIETPEIVAAGNDSFIGSPNVTFHTAMPKLKDVDIVYIRSALQYTRNPLWRLTRLIQLQPKYFILSHLSAGNVEPFVSLQEWYGHKIPYWFMNLSQIRQLFAQNGYELELQSSDEDLDQSNLPAERRILHTKNLVFKRVK